MLRRILVLVGETASSASARQYAFGLAQRTGAEIAGLAGVDFVPERMPGAIGSAFYRHSLDTRLRMQALDVRSHLRDVFESECRARNIPLSWLAFEGDSLSALYLAAETRDMVIAGHDTAFRSAEPGLLSEMLAGLVRVSPRPVVVCPGNPPKGDRILIAYDGTAPSMRAVQIFALLGIGQGQPIDVISIDENQELAARRSSGVAGYLRAHGHIVEENPVASRADPADVLRTEVANRMAGTLVIGAYGQRGFAEMLFGSATRNLIEDPPCALLIYH
jgi:nucleotide-binding universal stress UspA family protein